MLGAEAHSDIADIETVLVIVRNGNEQREESQHQHDDSNIE